MSSEVKEKNNKLLVGALVGLIVVIVGLVLGIVMANLHNEQQKIEQAEAELPEELRGNDLSPTDQVVKETSIMLQDPETSEEDIEAYYDEVIGKALADGDTEFASKIIVQKVNFLTAVESDCDKMQKYADGLDLSVYSADERGYIISYVISAADTCENQEMETQWKKYLNDFEGQ